MNSVNLERADLTGAILYGANLTNANLSNAVLSQAYILEASVGGANFDGAVITDMLFINVYGFSQAQFYSTASYRDHDLHRINIPSNFLDGWDLSNQNLSDVSLSGTSLAGTSFAGAGIDRINLTDTTYKGFTAPQLYSTANYQSRNLRGVRLAQNDLDGWDFSNQDLTGADFSGSTVGGANFQNTIISGMDLSRTGMSEEQLQSTVNYQSRDLRNMLLDRNDFTAWDFSNQNLTGTWIRWATLVNANFSGAIIAETLFAGDSGLAPEQLYSTASYQNRNLLGIRLEEIDLSGWDFSGQNVGSGSFYSRSPIIAANFSHADLTRASFFGDTLTNVNFSFANGPEMTFEDASLIGVNMRNANMMNVGFGIATLTNVNFSAADLRGTDGVEGPGVVTTNAILADGTIAGLNLGPDDSLWVREYPGTFWHPELRIPIRIAGNMSMAPGSTLRIMLDDDDWGSLISFQPGSSVIRGGNLLLDFDIGANLPDLVGTSWRLFDWAGVSPTGTFNILTSNPGFIWDTSDLYTTGYVTLEAVPEPALAGPIVLLSALRLFRRVRGRVEIA